MMDLHHVFPWRRLLMVAALLLCGMALPAAGQRSNIVFVLVDDMEYRLLDHMPQLQALAAQRGVEFRNNFVTLSRASPSRTTLLRGQYSHNTGIFTNHWPDGGFEKFHRDGLESSTIATWLQRAGYRTALMGRYLNGYPNDETGRLYVPPGWSDWFSPIGGDPYSQYNYRINFNGRVLSFGNAPEDHLNDVLLRQARNFLRTSASEPAARPFFLLLTPLLPHPPATPPARYAGLFPGVRVPRIPSFNEADLSDKPRWLRNMPLLSADFISELDATYRKRRQSTQALDDFVASLISTLRATGQLNNTYLFFSADNGYIQGEHRLPIGRGRLYEEDIRAPLVVLGPGITGGRVVYRLTSNVDYAPTIAEIARVTPPDFIDGRSLVPLLAGPPPARWRRVLLLESPSSNDSGAILRSQIYRGLRTAANQTFAIYENGDGEYYRMTPDPYQLANSYGTMDATLRASMRNQLQALRGAAGQALRAAEEVGAGAWPAR